MWSTHSDTLDFLRPRLILRTWEVVQLLGWTEGQLHMAVKRGQIPARKLGRRVIFLRDELEAYLEQLPPARMLDRTGREVCVKT